MELIFFQRTFQQPILQYIFATVILICAILSLKCFQKFSRLMRTYRIWAKLPKFERHPNSVYLSLLYNCYKSSKSGPSPIIYMFQIAHGIHKLYEKQGIFGQWVLTKPLVGVYDAKIAEVILSSPSTADKAQEYKFLHSWLGLGLLTSNGDMWKNQRKLLNPAFHLRALEDVIPVFNDKADKLVSKLAVLAKEQWVDVRKHVTLCSIDIICETSMGVCINAQEDTENEYIRAIEGMGELAIYRMFSSFMALGFIFNFLPSARQNRKNLKIIHDFSKKVLKEKKALRLKRINENVRSKGIEKEVKQGKRKTFIELLLDLHFQDPSFTEKNIKDEINTFMFAGHDTTTSGISFALYSIGLYSDIQNKISEELDVIFDGDNKRPVTAEDVKSMRYLDRVIKETMRLYPSVPFIGREVKEDIIVNGYIIPATSAVTILPYFVHRNSEIYPNPEVFDPDRFLPENSAERNPYAYIPFSAGPRNCIGQRFGLMEMKVILTHILRRFRVKSLDERDKVLIFPDMVLRSVNPIRIKLTPRLMKRWSNVTEQDILLMQKK